MQDWIQKLKKKKREKKKEKEKVTKTQFFPISGFLRSGNYRHQGSLLMM